MPFHRKTNEEKKPKTKWQDTSKRKLSTRGLDTLLSSRSNVEQFTHFPKIGKSPSSDQNSQIIIFSLKKKFVNTVRPSLSLQLFNFISSSPRNSTANSLQPKRRLRRKLANTNFSFLPFQVVGGCLLHTYRHIHQFYANMSSLNESQNLPRYVRKTFLLTNGLGHFTRSSPSPRSTVSFPDDSNP